MRRTITALAATALMLTASPALADEGLAWDRCRYEDGSSQRRCIWVGDRQGNGIGDSVKIFKGGTDDMRVKVISHRRARHLLNHRPPGQGGR